MGNFTFFATVTLTLTRWPSCAILTRIPYSIPCYLGLSKNVSWWWWWFSEDVPADQKWTFSTSRLSRVVLQTDKRTARHTDIQTEQVPPKRLPRRFVGGEKHYTD